jgi:DNA invertase Pin-like site-specific DNA recombinase
VKTKRAALYMRVSTNEQTTGNQRMDLEAAAATRGWEVVAVYDEPAVSGGKGRDERPKLDAMLKDAVRRKFDVVMVWAVDRLGRSLPDLVASMQELRGAKVDLFIHQQGLDTTTPAGRAMFGMLGVFSEFERAMTVARVSAGLARARAHGTKSGKAIGRPRIKAKIEQRIRGELAAGHGILKVASIVGVGSGTVQRIAKALR